MKTDKQKDFSLTINKQSAKSGERDLNFLKIFLQRNRIYLFAKQRTNKSGYILYTQRSIASFLILSSCAIDLPRRLSTHCQQTGITYTAPSYYTMQRMAINLNTSVNSYCSAPILILLLTMRGLPSISVSPFTASLITVPVLRAGDAACMCRSGVVTLFSNGSAP